MELLLLAKILDGPRHNANIRVPINEIPSTVPAILHVVWCIASIALKDMFYTIAIKGTSYVLSDPEATQKRK